MTQKKTTTLKNRGYIVILGAGPAGLACAMELQKEGKSLVMVEKDNKVGGLAKTHQFGRYYFDNGPHRFFSKNKYLYDLLEDLLHEKWIQVSRSTRFYIDGKFYHYPIDLLNIIQTMEPWQLTNILGDYVTEKIKIWKRMQKPTNFEAYAVSQFGRALAEFNMLDYNQKIWGIPPSQMSADWSEQRIKDLSFTEVLKNMLLGKSKAKSIVNEFYYPDHGTGMIYEAIKERVEKENTIYLKTVASRITHKNSEIKAVKLNNGKTYKGIDHLITSIPITELVKILNPPPPKRVINAATKLRFRSQVYIFITINRPSITTDQWIYFPDKEIPFARISEMKNFSKHMTPKDKTSLLIEYFCWEGDDIWNMDKNTLELLTAKWLKRLKLVDKSKIQDTLLIRQANTYPVYDVEYKKHLEIVKNYFDSFKNLITIGRLGRFKYTNQDHSLEMGLLAAKSVIDRKRRNVEDVGDDLEYFEKGKLREENTK